MLQTDESTIVCLIFGLNNNVNTNTWLKYKEKTYLHVLPHNTNIFSLKNVIKMGLWLCNKLPVNVKTLNKYQHFTRK